MKRDKGRRNNESPESGKIKVQFVFRSVTQLESVTHAAVLRSQRAARKLVYSNSSHQKGVAGIVARIVGILNFDRRGAAQTHANNSGYFLLF